MVIMAGTIAFTAAGCGKAGEGSDAAVTATANGVASTSTVIEKGAGITTPDETTPPVQSGAETPVTTTSVQGATAEVIVNLAIAWSPEDGVSDEELASLGKAQQEVLRLLDGTSFRVIRLYEITPQMALAVDGEGLKRLETSALIAQVSPNVLDAPTG
jgi:hypothetical protein